MTREEYIYSTLKSKNGGKLQINDVFRKRASIDIFQSWLDKYNLPKDLISLDMWCNRICNLGKGYEMIVEVKLIHDIIHSVFIGHEATYDDNGTNYSWQINMSWLSKKFLVDLDENLGFEGEFLEFIDKYYDDEQDKINIRFTVPSPKVVLPELFEVI